VDPLLQFLRHKSPPPPLLSSARIWLTSKYADSKSANSQWAFAHFPDTRALRAALVVKSTAIGCPAPTSNH
jgi:hypothetical protein